jgi:hypothetical protein
LSGTSNVAGLSVLGQTLPIDAAVSQALTLLNSQDIDLSKLDLSKVQLPAGLSFTTPGVGTLLQSVLGPILKSLPPIKIPAQLATVDVVPNEQIVSNGTLTQRALHVTVTLLAQNILDLVLGEARVSNASVNCAGPNQASQLALQCTTRKLTLIDVLQQGNRVKLLGAAQRTLIGKQVAIYFTSTHQQVATATVRPDGFFTATAPLPPMSVRYTNLARYQAVAGGEHSLNLKLHRRMVVSHISAKGGKVTISGQVIRPLASPTAGITIQRRVSCTSLVNVKRIMPDKNGNFSVTIAAPPHTQAAVYRAATFVRKFVTNPKRFPTFTLPQYVEL